MVIRS
jgi:hypothetical protein